MYTKKEGTFLQNIKSEIRKDSGVNAILLILFFFFELIIRFIALPVIADLFSTENKKVIQTYVFYFLVYVLLIPSLIFINGKLTNGRRTTTLKSCFCKPQMPASWVAKWIIITSGLCYLCAYISKFFEFAFEKLTGVELHPMIAYSDGSLSEAIINIISMVILAPLLEELFFRGTLFRNVSEYGGWGLIIIVGITFGLWHTNYEQTLYTALMGVFSCFMYEKTRSVIPSFILHIYLNSLGCLSSIFITNDYSQKILDGDMQYIMSHPLPFLVQMSISLIYIISIIAAITLLIIEICSHTDSFRLEQKNKEISSSRKLIAYISNPLMITAFIIMILIGIDNAFEII